MAYVTNASTIAYDFITAKIACGEWNPGSRIWTEAKLCEHLGVSRVAVRQAIDKLAARSVLYKRQGSGTFVCEEGEGESLGLIRKGEEDILDILEFRRYFEHGNVIMFVRHADQDDIQALEKNYAVMRQAARNKDMRMFYKTDYQFHNLIALGTRKTFIFRIATTLNQVLLDHQEEINEKIGPEIGLKYHELILESIRNQDEDLAALYMDRHIDAALTAIRETMK